MAASYLVQTRNGVFYARFVVPLAMRGSGPSISREIRVSTLTKDPRDAIARARLLRVLYEGLTLQDGLFSREHVTTYFKKIMAQFKAPPPGTPKFNVEYDFTTGRATFSDVKPDEQVTVLSMLDDMYKRLPMPAQQIATAQQNSANLSDEAKQPIAVMVRQYLEYQKGRESAGEIGPKNVPQRATRLGLFTSYFDGKTIGELTPNDIKIYMDDIAYYPTSRDVVGIEPGKSVREVIELSKAKKLRKPSGEICPTLAKLTVKGYMLALADFMNFCDLKLAVMDRTASRMKSIVNAAPQARVLDDMKTGEVKVMREEVCGVVNEHAKANGADWYVYAGKFAEVEEWHIPTAHIPVNAPPELREAMAQENRAIVEARPLLKRIMDESRETTALVEATLRAIATAANENQQLEKKDVPLEHAPKSTANKFSAPISEAAKERTTLLSNSLDLRHAYREVRQAHAKRKEGREVANKWRVRLRELEADPPGYLVSIVAKMVCGLGVRDTVTMYEEKIAKARESIDQCRKNDERLTLFINDPARRLKYDQWQQLNEHRKRVEEYEATLPDAPRSNHQHLANSWDGPYTLSLQLALMVPEPWN